MRKRRFTEAKIIGMIKEQEAGMPTAEVCRRHSLSPAKFYKLKSRYAGIEDFSIAKSGLIHICENLHEATEMAYGFMAGHAILSDATEEDDDA